MKNTSLKIFNKLTEGVDYSNNLDTFNQIITEWDFLGDVTDPYVAGVSVDGDKIGVSCELWDPDVDDFVSCDGGEFEAPEIVKMLKEVDFNNTADVYQEARPIYQAISQLIDWDTVSDTLFKLRDEELRNNQ